MTEILNYTNENDAISRINEELKEVEKILSIFKDKFGENSEEFKKILKEYIEIQKIFLNENNKVKEISKNKWNTLLKEINDIMLLGNKYLKENKEYSVEELKISKFEFLKYNKNGQFESGNKEQIDLFLNSSLSISSLSEVKIGKLLSGIYDLGDEYIEKFVKRFVIDEEGLDYLIRKWQPGSRSIDNFLNGKNIGSEKIGFLIKNAIIDKIIESLDNKIRSDLEKSFRKKYPNISKNDLEYKINGIINKIKKEKRSEYVFQILLNELQNVDLSIEIGKNELRKRQTENIKSQKTDVQTKENFKKITKELYKIQQISNTNNKLNQEDKETFHSTISKFASDKKQMTTSMIIAKTVTELEKKGDCKDLVKILKADFKKEIEYGNKELKEYKNLSNLQQSQYLTSENTFSYTDGTKLSYSENSSGGFLIETQYGKIEVNAKELDIIKYNKDVLENIIKFREMLKELNLVGLFKYREGIFKAISNKYTIAFNINNDYLNENELIIFIKAILKSIGYELHNTTDMDSIKSEIKQINKVGLIGGINEINIFGDSYIEHLFIEKFDPKRISIFNQNAFENSL